MQQWREVKARHQDALVFFRVGDFYEMFNEDAEEGASLLGLTLTSRNNGSSRAPLAGIPAHSLDSYLTRLLKLGRRVAICEQVEDPADARGIVRREVVETVTPGTVLDEGLLDGDRNNFIAAVATAGDSAGVAAADLSTGELTLERIPRDTLADALRQLAPSELLLPRSAPDLSDGGTPSWICTTRGDSLFDPANAADELKRFYGVLGLEGFGLGGEEDDLLVAAAGALLAYAAEVQPRSALLMRPPRVLRNSSRLLLDQMTCRNLELVEPLFGGAREGTLLGVIGDTRTPMGARLLRRWLLQPLGELRPIHDRQNAVGALFSDAPARTEVRANLKRVGDLERLGTRVVTGRAGPRDLLAIATSIEPLPALRGLLGSLAEAPLLGELAALDTLEDVRESILGALDPGTGGAGGEGPVIRQGYHPELDELRELHSGAVGWIARMQATERQRTGIGSLKVGFNKVFGYYLEITRANLDRVPPEYQRKQTLANAERFFTPELKEWEEKVLSAEERIAELEARLLRELREQLAAEAPRLHRAAEMIARADVLAGFAEVAVRRDYVRPEVHDGFALRIRRGRHPVVETMMPRETFIPNDVELDGSARVMILTGPNMAGKSTVLRQTGLAVVLAHMGSFVPAAEARVPLTDRLFTRVGAADNLVRGQSTFMVEMSETAAILHGATARSLVLLDEIGRGTATWDGLSVATAVTEHLHDHIGAKTMFATHYHELTELEHRLDSLVNFSVAVEERGDDILFLRRLVPGGADRSYGVEVARLAGLPPAVVRRARSVLSDLEATSERRHRQRDDGARAFNPVQLALFEAAPHPVVERLSELDIDDLTPLQALNLIAELAAEARPAAARA